MNGAPFLARLSAVVAESATVGPPVPCPYLPGRTAHFQHFMADELPAGVYHGLMDLNFRRIGRLCYRPHCDPCHECRMIRVRVNAFRPSRSQRRCLTRNSDLVVQLAPPRPERAAFELYQRYLVARHDRQMSGSWEEFVDFLCASNTATLAVTFRLREQLLALGVIDVAPQALSAVYLAYEPAAGRRALGVFNVLWLVEECRRRGVSSLYLGYYVREARTMSYKASYRPCELLAVDGVWREFPFAAAPR
jgi:leucyl-tRNA---protein transferase